MGMAAPEMLELEVEAGVVRGSCACLSVACCSGASKRKIGLGLCVDVAGCCCCGCCGFDSGTIEPAPPLARRWFDDTCCAICALFRCMGVEVVELLADPAALEGPEDDKAP